MSISVVPPEVEIRRLEGELAMERAKSAALIARVAELEARARRIFTEDYLRGWKA